MWSVIMTVTERMKHNLFVIYVEVLSVYICHFPDNFNAHIYMKFKCVNIQYVIFFVMFV